MTLNEGHKKAKPNQHHDIDVLIGWVANDVGFFTCSGAGVYSDEDTIEYSDDDL